jgi:hypothetical protein
VTRETQPERTRLAWLRTWLSLAAVGAAEARLVTEHHAGVIGVALAALLGAVGWRVLRGRDAVLAQGHRPGDGREPLLMAACAVGVGLLGVTAVLGA